LAQGLAAAGLGDVPGGTLYPSLLRLEKQGLVDTVWERSTAGPPRKYYQVTTTGRESFAERSDEWRRFRGALDSLTDMADDRASGNAS
jgi:PadR family transcriptional regulator PadR